METIYMLQLSESRIQLLALAFQGPGGRSFRLYLVRRMERITPIPRLTTVNRTAMGTSASGSGQPSKLQRP